MGGIEQIFKDASKKQNEWCDKNRWIIRLLGLSRNEAVSHRELINKIYVELSTLVKSSKKFIAISLFILAILSVTNSFYFLNTAKVCNLISIYLGLISSFIISYGFLLGLRKDNKINTNPRIIYMPDSPTRPENIAQYASNINKIIVDLINSNAREKTNQFIIEFRKQFSLAVGFILLSFSFIIQIILTFV